MTHTELGAIVSRAVRETPITDIHTHLYDPALGGLLLWGIDEALTYHYLVAETMRWSPIPAASWNTMPREERADHVWRTLFLEHSPVSESTRGLLETLQQLGLDVSSRDLAAWRRWFDEQTTEGFVDRVLEIANVRDVVMTNDPFDAQERSYWMEGFTRDPRFHAALRLDGLLNQWPHAAPQLAAWGYAVQPDFSGETAAEVRRFLNDWIERLDALYMAVSLPPSFVLPEDSPRGRLFAECVFPVAAQRRIPMALMIGVKKLTNPDLGLAGDSVGHANIDVLEWICRDYPDVKLLVTMLSRENQHELCVCARKFSNLHVFGCWWFLNSGLLVSEITRMRLEWLGLSMTPQHSDARVLDQVIYKWRRSLKAITEQLTLAYQDLADTGWQPSEAEIRRDVAGLLGGQFWDFVKR